MTNTIRWVSAVVLLAATLAAGDGEVEKGRVGRDLGRWIEDVEAVGFHGTVLAVRDGDVVVAKGVGEAAPGMAMEPATLLDIGSASEIFTALTVLGLVDEGRLALDDRVGALLPDVPASFDGVTVRDLLRHESGRSGEVVVALDDDIDEIIGEALAAEPSTASGVRRDFWRAGYWLLERIVERVSGTPYVDRCREAVLLPLGMHATTFAGHAPPPGVSVATRVDAAGVSVPCTDLVLHDGGRALGATPVLTNVWDLERLDRALTAHEVLSLAATRELFEAGADGFATGWFVTRATGDRVAHLRQGITRDFATTIVRYPDPDDDALLVILCARERWLATMPFRDLLEKVLFDEDDGPGFPYIDIPKPLDPKLAHALAGTYRTEDGEMTLHIRVDGLATKYRIVTADSPQSSEASLCRDGKRLVAAGSWSETRPADYEKRGKTIREVRIHVWTFERVDS